jgi:predicted membrane protein DUF2157
MHSLEEELSELRSAGAIDDATATRAMALERRTIFSVFDELRVVLYTAVALVVTGVGILIKDHLDRIGPVTLMFVLALVGGACYVPAIREKLRGAAYSPLADYLLLLGALLVSADLGYAETQFHWFGANWSRHLLILTTVHAFTAYALESRLVLSVALVAGGLVWDRARPRKHHKLAFRHAGARFTSDSLRSRDAWLARDRSASERRPFPRGVRTDIAPRRLREIGS